MRGEGVYTVYDGSQSVVSAVLNERVRERVAMVSRVRGCEW